MIYLPIVISELMFCDVFQWIQQYFNNLNDIFDGCKSENHTKYWFNVNIHCATIDCILILVMDVICTIYFAYSLYCCKK